MRILFVTPELAPWSKAGGLGDATVALGKALAAMGHEVRAVTPLYGSVPGREKMGTLIEALKVGVGGDPRTFGDRERFQSAGQRRGDVDEVTLEVALPVGGRRAGACGESKETKRGGGKGEEVAAHAK